MKVKINANCIGCGICASIAPEIFEVSPETGKSELRSNIELNDENLAKIRAAAEGCQIGAIEIEE